MYLTWHKVLKNTKTRSSCPHIPLCHCYSRSRTTIVQRSGTTEGKLTETKRRNWAGFPCSKCKLLKPINADWSSWILDNVDNIHFMKNQNKNDMIAGSFRVKLFIEWWCAEDLGKYSGCFMIIRWPISWFVYQVTSFYVPTCECQMAKCRDDILLDFFISW